MEANAKRRQIDLEIRNYELKISRIEDLKNKKQGGYYEGNQ